MSIDLPALMRVVDDTRHDRRLNWRQVAAQTGISHVGLSKLLNNRVYPSTDTFVTLLDWLDLKPQALGTLLKTIIRET
jgi:transcriptional regulator with XRE-family HTH domain